MVKKLLCFICLAVILICYPVFSVSAETKSYSSKVGVGFTGEYVYPDSDETKTDTDETEGETNGTANPGKSNGGTSAKSPIPLPKTDDINNVVLLLWIMPVSVFAFLWIYRKSAKDRVKS